MANFFKSDSVRDFPTSSARIQSNMNMTGSSNLPLVPQSQHEASISPLSKEIDYRLKILNKILPHEHIVKLSQDIIGRLESACFDKVAESLCSDTGLPNAYGGASSICSSTTSQRFNLQARAMPSRMTSLLAPVDDRRNATQLMFNAAKNLRLEKDDLETINEEPQAIGLTINSSREQLRAKGKLKTLKSLAVPSSQELNDTDCFRKPAAPTHTQKPRANQRNSDSSVTKANSRRKRINEADSPVDLDLTITKSSLRSNSRTYKHAAPRDTKGAKLRKVGRNDVMNSPHSNYDEDEPVQDVSPTMNRILSQPIKKTALSPFFNRFKSRCNSKKITSTPFKR